MTSRACRLSWFNSHGSATASLPGPGRADRAARRTQVVARLQQLNGAQERQEEQEPSTARHAAHAGHQQARRRDPDHQQDGPVDEALPPSRSPDIPRDRRHARAPA